MAAPGIGWPSAESHAGTGCAAVACQPSAARRRPLTAARRTARRWRSSAACARMAKDSSLMLQRINCRALPATFCSGKGNRSAKQQVARTYHTRASSRAVVLFPSPGATAGVADEYQEPTCATAAARRVVIAGLAACRAPPNHVATATPRGHRTNGTARVVDKTLAHEVAAVRVTVQIPHNAACTPRTSCCLCAMHPQPCGTVQQVHDIL